MKTKSSTVKNNFVITGISTLLILSSFLSTTAAAKIIEAQSLQKNYTNASFDFKAWQSKFHSSNEKQRFLKTDAININTTINATRHIGENANIYIFAKANGVSFMQDKQRQWHPFTGKFIVFDNRVLGEKEEVTIISNLQNLPLTADILVGYSTPEGDIIYNKEAFSIRIDESYNKILTVGKNGKFKDCNGLQFAFNVVQDWEEIRIEQGLYPCTELSIPDAKLVTDGIFISGGWDNTFTQQSNDPKLTVFDGGAEIINDKSIVDRAGCLALFGTWKGIDNKGGLCYQEAPSYNNQKNILDLNQKNISLDTLLFRNSLDDAVYGGGGSREPGSINNCIFIHNFGHSSYGLSFIYNSLFEENVSTATTFSETIMDSTFINNLDVDNGTSAAVYDTRLIINSNFTNNTSLSSSGAVYKSLVIKNSVFTGNESSEGAVGGINQIHFSTFKNNHSHGYGGAVSKGKLITNSTFINNTATMSGGAVSGVSNIHSSTFNGNSAGRDGGAILNISLLTNSFFVNNTSKKNGGALILSTGNIVINNTFVKNTATQSGGAIYGDGKVYNSIFSENSAAGDSNDIHSTASGGDFILDYSLLSMATGSIDIRPGVILDTPLFVDAGKGDYHLQANSPAVNSGDDSRTVEDYTELFNDTQVDLDNMPRMQGGRIDMGAYEHQ